MLSLREGYENCPQRCSNLRGRCFTAGHSPAITENTPLAWGKLLSFRTCALAQPVANAGSGDRDVSLTTRVKRQVQAFLQADSLVAPERVTYTRNVGNNEDIQLRKRVAAKFADGDLKGAVRLLASSDTVAPRDDRTLELLQQKHPPVPEDLALPEPPDGEEQAVVGQEEVKKALGSFRPGSAGGPDGLRPGHLLSLISCRAAEAGVRLLASLTNLVNLILSGGVPEFARAVLFGATLCGLSKKDGGIRPIAVGSTFRRLATKVGAWPLSADIGDSLRPVQLGFSTKGGCEAAAHAARRYLNEASHRRVIFKIDMANAFNSLRRDVFLSAVQLRSPPLYRMLWQAYARPSTLFFWGCKIRVGDWYTAGRSVWAGSLLVGHR